MIRAVFFDVGNTLLYPYPSVSEVVRQVLETEGHVHDLDAIDAWMPLVDEYYEERYREDDTFWTDEGATHEVWVGMYALLCRKLGVEEDAERLAHAVYEEFGDASRWRAYEDVGRTFGMLRECGVKIGLISNWDSRLRGIIERLGLGEYVDTIVSSADVGLHKPDPRIFELALGHVGVSARDAAHVGDHEYADVLGATGVGMTPVLIDRHGGPEPSPHLAERFVRSLDELGEVLQLPC
ncbi:MAG: HAD-IA family hydrolase [Coriobacteriales bacterium]|nr:HAD-IA family hydrolase [Coriobacteriales bacterium]